jgi:hypothetical protein
VFRVDVTDDDTGTGSAQTTVVVNPENAVPTYVGPTFASSDPGSNKGEFTVELRAVVQDITFFTGDPLHDNEPGNITRDDIPTGMVTFVIQPMGGGSTVTLPVEIVRPDRFGCLDRSGDRHVVLPTGKQRRRRNL